MHRFERERYISLRHEENERERDEIEKMKNK
jgi:hypothetical protein